jgi:hypothetical protein
MLSASRATEALRLPRTRGLPGRVLEFALVGGLTPLSFALAWALRGALGLEDAELAVGFTFFYAAHLINDPHFAVSYLLFYEDVRERALGRTSSLAQRLRYWTAGLLVPLGLAAWIASALWQRSTVSLGALIQLMFLLVGWHYVKQGFGVLMVLGARRGVRFHTRERRALLLHALVGWAYAWASPFDPGRTLQEKGVPYATFAHPAWLEPLTRALFLGSALWLGALLWQKARREGGLPLLTPLCGYLCSIWAWSVFSGLDPLVRYAIPALHSLQYLYFVWLLKAGEAREREGPPWFEPSVGVRVARLAMAALTLGWLLFHGLPAWLDSPRTRSPLGPTPWFAALYAFVNIHHYFIDSVLWRRDNPRTRYLQATHAVERTI